MTESRLWHTTTTGDEALGDFDDGPAQIGADAEEVSLNHFAATLRAEVDLELEGAQLVAKALGEPFPPEM